MLMKRFIKSTMMIIALVFITKVSYSDLHACTGIKLRAKDGSVVHGRTLEFGKVIQASVAVVPRGYEFIGTTPQGKGLAYKAKYASVGVMAFDALALMDGMNEKGLAVGTFYFPGYAEYAKITLENQSKALSPVEFPNWILAQFSTLDEVKAGLSQIVIAPTVAEEWGSQPPPFHYIVYDKAGNCLVIEPIKGKLVISDNKLGVFTNSPDFEWQMTNLRNYINLTPFNVKPLTIEGIEFAPFGQGSGMVGLPGDFTPPSRFVRATIFSSTATPSDSANEAIFQVFHILNQFDIPVGVARENVNGVIHSDYTQFTCARDPKSLKYYFRSYDDQAIKVVDLSKFDYDAKIIKKAIAAGKQAVQDMTADLK